MVTFSTCLQPQMTPMKTAFKLQNYFYLHNYGSVLNELIENLLTTPCKLLYFIIKQ